MSKFGQGFITGIFCIAFLVGITSYMSTETGAYNAELPTPIVISSGTDVMLSGYSCDINTNPDVWKAMNGAQKLAAVTYTFKFDTWHINDKGRWEIISGKSAEMSMSGTEWFTGDNSGNAAAVKSQINAKAIENGIIPAGAVLE